MSAQSKIDLVFSHKIGNEGLFLQRGKTEELAAAEVLAAEVKAVFARLHLNEFEKATTCFFMLQRCLTFEVGWCR